MLPRPPIREAPPSTTAAMAFSSNVSPVAGCMAAQKPEIVNQQAHPRHADAGKPGRAGVAAHSVDAGQAGARVAAAAARPAHRPR
jgi:hypothetical protein